MSRLPEFLECCHWRQSENLKLEAGTELCKAAALLFEFEVLLMRPAGKELRVQVDCEPAMCHCSKEANSLLGCIRESLREVIFPSVLVRHIWSRIFSLGSPFRRKTWMYWSESREEP